MNHISNRLFVIIVSATLMQVSCTGLAKGPTELFRTDGPVSAAGSQWEYLAGTKDKMVYIPFEGMYPNKGGRMQSPWFELPDTKGQGAYYRLTFKAKTAEHCYWWLDYHDKNGKSIPDCNSEVYVGDKVRDYDEVVYVPGAVRRVQIAFVSKQKVEASDIRFTTATAAEAAQWSDDLYKTLPPLKFVAPADSMKLLPKTVAAMKNGKSWRVVMLGSSLMNDTFNSLFMALIQRDFPKSNFNVVTSVRGSTGCSYFRKPEHFKKYVIDQKPDLLIVLGDRREGAHVAEVVKKARREVGCEVVVMSGALGQDWRRKDDVFDPSLVKAGAKSRASSVAAVPDFVSKLKVAYWDLNALATDYLITAGDVDFNRDWVHANDNGKQIIGRLLHKHFLTAKQ